MPELNVADFLPSTPEILIAGAAMFTRVLKGDVPLEAIAEIVVKVNALVSDYETYKGARDEYLGSEIWQKIARVHTAADELLRAMAPFLDASPLSPGGSGAFLLGMYGLRTAAPATWTDPFIARLKALCANAERAAADLYPQEGPGNPNHKHNKHVELTRRALALLPTDGISARARNAFVGLVFEIAGEPQSQAEIRQLVHRTKAKAT